MLHANGIILTEEGFGNPEVDMMMVCAKAKAIGIESVLIGDEYAGPDGLSQGLADVTPEADAFVSAGNANEVIEIPTMREALGYDETLETLAGGRRKLNGKLQVELQVFTGSTNALGYSKLRCLEY
jgi:glycine reductase